MGLMAMMVSMSKVASMESAEDRLVEEGPPSTFTTFTVASVP
jgi:hypothetical protein